MRDPAAGRITTAAGAARRCLRPDGRVTIPRGQLVPGAFATVESTASANASRTVTATGILTGVPAGTHTVTIPHKLTGQTSGHGMQGDVRVVAIALGG